MVAKRILVMGGILVAGGSILFLAIGKWEGNLEGAGIVARSQSHSPGSSREVPKPGAPLFEKPGSPSDLAKEFDDILRRHDRGEEDSFILERAIEGLPLERVKSIAEEWMWTDQTAKKRSYFLGLLFKRWAQLAPEEAWAVANDRYMRKSADGIHQSVFAGTFIGWSLSDPSAALAAYTEYKDSPLSREFGFRGVFVSFQLMESFAAVDAIEAWDKVSVLNGDDLVPGIWGYYAGLPEGTDWHAHTTRVYDHVPPEKELITDQALELAGNAGPDPSMQAGVLPGVGEIETRPSPARTVRFVSEHGLATRWANDDLAAAIRWYATDEKCRKSGSTPRQRVMGLIEVCITDETEQVVRWVGEHSSAQGLEPEIADLMDRCGTDVAVQLFPHVSADRQFQYLEIISRAWDPDVESDSVPFFMGAHQIEEVLEVADLKAKHEKIIQSRLVRARGQDGEE